MRGRGSSAPYSGDLVRELKALCPEAHTRRADPELGASLSAGGTSGVRIARVAQVAGALSARSRPYHRGVGLPTPAHLPGSSHPKWRRRLWKCGEEATGWLSPPVPARARVSATSPSPLFAFLSRALPFSLGVEPHCGREPISSEPAPGTTRCRRSGSPSGWRPRVLEPWTPQRAGRPKPAGTPGQGEPPRVALGRHRGSP